MAAYFVIRLQQDRMALATSSLCNNLAVHSSLTNSLQDGLFTHQIHVLGKKHDMLCVISTYGQCNNLCQVIKTAHERYMPVLAINRGSDGEIVALLRSDDFWPDIPMIMLCVFWKPNK